MDVHNTPSAPPGPVADVVVQDRHPSLRIFQVLTGVACGALFIIGLFAVVRVDFGAGWLRVSGEVLGLGFSPVAAIAALILGGIGLIAAFADQDRGGTGLVGLITLGAGIAVMVMADEGVDGATVDRDSGILFLVIGVIVFALSLVPWWGGRRRTTTVVS